MPAILERLVSQLKAKGYNERASYAIATASLKRSGNLDEDGNATPKGERRGAMTPGERAKDRAAKRSGRKTRDYDYNASTNRATLKKHKKRKRRTKR